MPAFYTSGQSCYSCRHPTSWASLQSSYTFSRTPSHGAWTPAPLSAHLFTRCLCIAFHIETPIWVCHPTTHQFIWQPQRMCSTLGDHQWKVEWLDNLARPRTFIPNISPSSLNDLARTVWVYLNHLSTGVGQFHSCLHKWDMASSTAYYYGAEEHKNIDPVVLQCPIHRPPHGLHSLMVLDDVAILTPGRDLVWPSSGYWSGHPGYDVSLLKFFYSNSTHPFHLIPFVSLINLKNTFRFFSMEGQVALI